MLGDIGEVVLLVVLAPKDVVAVVVEQRLMQNIALPSSPANGLGIKEAWQPLS